MVYLISYDLNSKPESSYEDLINAIKDYGDYCKPLKSQWFISTSGGISAVYNNLASHIMKNDRLFICEIGSSRKGWLEQSIWTWLSSHGL